MLDSLTIPAHAKVNLALAVGPPEPATSPRPGWHRIASWMSCIDLADDLTLTRLPDGSPTTYAITWAADAPRPSPIDWPIEKDLAVRAHRLLEHHVGRSLPIDLKLAKRIPVGGGLGGGSSDAAAMLTGLNRLFDLRIPPSPLRALAAQLGSDIAFFIDDHHEPARPALVTAFGDHVERVPFIDADVLLVIPPFGCPTKNVYAAYDAILHERSADPASRERTSPPAALDARPLREQIAAAQRLGLIDPRSLHNDLLPAACRIEPRLPPLLKAMARATGHHPLLTGSGSCCFLLTPPAHGERPEDGELRLESLLAHAAGPDEARDIPAGCALVRTRLC